MKIIGIKNNTFKSKLTLTSSGSKAQSPPEMERIYRAIEKILEE